MRFDKKQFIIGFISILKQNFHLTCEHFISGNKQNSQESDWEKRAKQRNNVKVSEKLFKEYSLYFIWAFFQKSGRSTDYGKKCN